jgi:hypothetical protein
VSLAVLIPCGRTEDPLVAEETQLGRAVSFSKIFFMARTDMVPSLRGRPPGTRGHHPWVSFFSCMGTRSAEAEHGKSGNSMLIGFPPRPDPEQWQFSGSRPRRKATSASC